MAGPARWSVPWPAAAPARRFCIVHPADTAPGPQARGAPNRPTAACKAAAGLHNLIYYRRIGL
jgi:hypothetical protein